MFYIKLYENYRSFDRAMIKEVYFSNLTSDSSVSFKYQICKKENNEIKSLFEKSVIIEDSKEISFISNYIEGSSAVNTISKALLYYMTKHNIENGTIEKE